jgi:hypothetical protein
LEFKSENKTPVSNTNGSYGKMEKVLDKMGTESLRNVDTKHFSQTQWLPIKKRKA